MGQGGPDALRWELETSSRRSWIGTGIHWLVRMMMGVTVLMVIVVVMTVNNLVIDLFWYCKTLEHSLSVSHQVRLWTMTQYYLFCSTSRGTKIWRAKGAYLRSHPNQGQNHNWNLGFRLSSLVAFSVYPLPLRSCKYLLSLVIALCWASLWWVGLKGGNKEFARTPCSSMFHPPAPPGILLTFKLCISINKTCVYTNQSPKVRNDNGFWTRPCKQTLLSFNFSFHVLSSTHLYIDMHFLTCAYLKS